MSYSCEISFKNISAPFVYEFLQTLKSEVLKKVDDVAKDNFLWMPSIRNSHLYKDVEDHIIREIDKAWVHDLLKFRFFYLPEHELLGIFGLPGELEELFDNVTYFQNSCDQDYSFDEWKGVPLFEEIANKWENKFTDAEVFAKYEEKHGEWYKGDKFTYDYHRRSLCYEEIWSHISQFLYDDKSCVYLSLLGGYELVEVYGLVGKCKYYHEEWLKEIENDEELNKRVAEFKKAIEGTKTESES